MKSLRECEQLRADLSLDIAPDQVLSPSQQRERIMYVLGKEHCSIVTLCGHKVLLYECDGKKYVLLHKAISYLGNPHPLFKKRIQIPTYFKTLCESVCDYEVHFIGVYHYQGLVLFTDFSIDTYLPRALHNSSTHVYTNDFFQALKNGIFYREDQQSNHIHTLRVDKLRDYLSPTYTDTDKLFEVFKTFNQQFFSTNYLYALDAIKAMYNGKWSQWKQAEWAGWFLEYKFSTFLKQHHITNIQYVGCKNKTHNKDVFDFDLYFPQEPSFYGDLKASDASKVVTPGNDQQTFVDCINKYERFWYVIYEHETIKDASKNYRATMERNQFIRSIDSTYCKDNMSYCTRMKNSVRFIRMTILELNRINFRSVLSDFNQGHQPDGSARKKKFIIRKQDIDNYVVFRYKCPI